MNDYEMDENMGQRKRNICDTSRDQINWRVWGHDFSNSSNVAKASVDSGIEMNNDSVGSNTVMQNDSNLSNSTMPNSSENMIELPNHRLHHVHDILRRFSNEKHKTNSETSCTIKEIDQSASSSNALPNTLVIDGMAPEVKFVSNNSGSTRTSKQLHLRRVTSHAISKEWLRRKSALKNITQLKRCDSNKGAVRRTQLCAYDRYWVSKAALERRLCFATSVNNVESVEEMLNTGVSPNCRDTMGRTPLHIAMRSGYSSIVSLLLKHGADVQLSDIKSTTPFQAAITCGGKSSITLVDEAVSQPSLGSTLKITGGVLNSNTNDLKAEDNDITDICCSNNSRGFDQQVEALSNVCSQLSFSNAPDEFQGSF